MSSYPIAPEEIRYMREAIKEAREGIRNGHGGPFGSVIVRDGDSITTATGYSFPSGHTMNAATVYGGAAARL